MKKLKNLFWFILGKFGCHGVERAIGRERNVGGEMGYKFSDDVISPKCAEYSLKIPFPPSNIDII